MCISAGDDDPGNGDLYWFFVAKIPYVYIWQLCDVSQAPANFGCEVRLGNAWDMFRISSTVGGTVRPDILQGLDVQGGWWRWFWGASDRLTGPVDNLLHGFTRHTRVVCTAIVWKWRVSIDMCCDGVGVRRVPLP